jgi:hypothetical protein
MRGRLIPGLGAGVAFPGLLLISLLNPAPGTTAPGLPSDPVTVEDAPKVFDLPVEPVRAEGGRIRDFSPQVARYPARVNDTEIRFAVQAVAVVAGEDLVVEAPVEVHLLDRKGPVTPAGPGRWVWTAPDEPGVVPLRLDAPQGRIDLNVLVMVPATEVKDGRLNGYRIGRYVQNPATGNPVYQPPKGFAEVRPEDEDILVSPHFTLGQFLCKDPGDPRYVVLSEPLVAKLEAVLAAVNRAGHRTPTLHVMSGFRTPAYNRAIGNTTDLSRHLWGDAADIFIDTNGDGMMDDLTGDGRVNDADAQVLVRIVAAVEQVDRTVKPGGISLYRTIPGRGPFVHVDARGTPARW